MCTKLDVVGFTWGPDRQSAATDWTYAENRSWVSTKAGPALCGRTGDPASRRLGCTLLTSTGWRFIGLPRATDWGYADARAWVPSPGGTVSYCRTVGDAASQRVMCTKLDVVGFTWGPDRQSAATDWTYADDLRPA